MATRHVISGVTFTNSIGKSMPDIPGLQALGFWGTGGDGINSNRAPGGPSFAPIGTAPSYALNYMTVGQAGVNATAVATVSAGVVTQIAVLNGGSGYTAPPNTISINAGGNVSASATAAISGGAVTSITVTSGGSGYTTTPTVTMTGGNFSALDLGVPRSAIINAGWTTAFVARVPATGLYSLPLGDITGLLGWATNFQMRNADGNHNNSPVVSFWIGGQERTFFVLPTPATNWRFICQTYTGGNTGTFTTYNLTDNQSGSYVLSGIAYNAPNGQQFHIGPHNASRDPSANADVAFGMVSSTPLSATFLQNLYGSVQSILARRGITC